MPQNIKIVEMLGPDCKGYNYVVSTNWRLDLSKCPELRTLIGDQADGDPSVINQMSFACHSNFQFKAETEYATAKVKGIPISQAAWQDRTIDSLPLDVYESMDHRVFKALLRASNNTAGYLRHRDVNDKKLYTMSGITLQALGNTAGNGGGDVKTEMTYYLQGVQIVSVESPEYTSDSAELGSVRLELKAVGWTTDDDNNV